MTSGLLTIFLTVYAVCSMVICLPTNDWHFRGQNIARHGITSQKPATYNDGYPSHHSYQASLAVDGNKMSCSKTTDSYPNKHIPQWRVDLRGTYSVTGIIIVKNYLENLNNFLVYGLNSNRCSEWCELYNDTGRNAYNRATIHIAIDSGQSYNTVAINLPGGVSLTLCEVEIFAAPRPVCHIPEPSEQRHVAVYKTTGLFVNGSYTVGTILQFSCEGGFRINGSNFIKCLNGGEFNQTIPVCTAACESISIDNGHIHPQQTLYAVHSHATIVCSDGFLPLKQEITCQHSGNWNQYQQCKQVFCDYPSRPENGHYISYSTKSTYKSSSLPFGSTITGRCNNGYDSNTNTSRLCQSNQTWTGIPLSCTKKSCHFPGHIVNGLYLFHNGSTYMSGSSFYDTTIEIKCNKGYTVNGSKVLTCGSNKTWGKVATCQIVTCNFPERPINGSYATEGINGEMIPYNHGVSNYLATIHSVCPEGNVLNSTSGVRQCLETGSWSGENGKCYLVTCKRLGELEGGFYNYSKESFANEFPYRTVVTAECKDTFKLAEQEHSHRLCSETGSWDKRKAVCISSKAKAEKSRAGLIGGLSAAVVCLLLVSFVTVIFVRRRRQCLQNKEGNPKRYGNLFRKDNSSNRNIANPSDGDYAEIQEAQSSTSNGSTSLSSQQAYYSFTNVNKVPKTAILVKDLSDLVLTGDAAKAKFEKEFQNLPQGMVEEHKEALKRQNVGKNRYRNLYAYDDTRVVLDTDDKSQSDYINACYVHGFKKAKKYIASQGPTKEILTDFWRMIGQTETSKIVMLTNVVEEGKTKCEEYWPVEGSSSTYGTVTVSTEKTENFSQFVIRTLKIRNTTSKQKSKTISQFHFTAWPDRGVPKYASSLVHFLNKVKYAPVHGKGPIVVHCSAGVGRTGTFIALDYLTEQGKTMSYVDVFGTVASLRTQRVSLVQTLEQYIFVHHALIESLMLSTSALPAAKFPDAFQELLQMDSEKKKRKICVEFETLKTVSPVADECEYVSSKLVRNRQKNRYSNVLPVEEFMPSLMSDSYNGDSRYINAVFLPSYKEQKAFIITQTPLESTRDDFWSLVWEHDVHTIVMMNTIRETTDSERYWPHMDETSAFANIEITNDGFEEINEHQVVSFSVKKYKVTRNIKQIRCGRWHPKHSLPDSPEVILTLMELVQASQQQSGNHTVLVHCMNGADKSGLFCVISAVIERMKIEQDVAISQVIEEMRNAREQIIPSVEQYQFCHEAVLDFIQKYDTYSNFTA